MSRTSLSFPKTKRLTLSSEFARVKGQGTTERGRYLVLGAAKVKEEDHDIEEDLSTPDLPPAPAPKKQITANTTRPVDRKPHESDLPPPVQSLSFSSQSALTKLADGFDLPIGKPDARGCETVMYPATFARGIHRMFVR